MSDKSTVGWMVVKSGKMITTELQLPIYWLKARAVEAAEKVKGEVKMVLITWN